MGWVKLDDSFYDHPGHASLPLEAWGLWAWSLAWANRNLTDGRIPSAVVERMDPTGQVSGALVDAGRWEQGEGCVVVHDYLEFQRSAAQIKELSEKRAESGRRGGQSTRPANSPVEPKQRRSKPEANRQAEPQPQGHAPTERAPTRRGRLFSKITDVLGIDPDMLTASERGDVNKTVKELDQAGIEPDALDGFPAWWRREFPGAALTHRCFRQHWAKYASNGNGSRPRCREHPDRGCVFFEGTGWLHSDEVRA